MAHALVAQSYPPRPIQATPQLLSRAVVALHHLEALWNHPYLRIIYCTTALLPPSSLMTKRLVGAMLSSITRALVCQYHADAATFAACLISTAHMGSQYSCCILLQNRMLPKIICCYTAHQRQHLPCSSYF
jgi:hypothetical protein